MKVSRNMWRMPLLRGLALLALGVLLLVEPLSGLQNLIYLFSGFLLLDGILAAAQGLLNRDQVGWKWWLVQGGVDAAFAVLIIAWPESTALVLFYVLIVWALVLGVVAIIGGVALLRNRDLGWSWLLTTGLISALFGVMLVTRAQTAGSILDLVVVVFGLYAFVLGAVHIVSTFSMRWVAQEIDRALAGQSLVVSGVGDRREAARQSAVTRSDERKAAKAHSKSGVVVLEDSDDVARSVAGPVTSPVISPGAADDHARDDERAALAFPDTPGVVTPPVMPLDQPVTRPVVESDPRDRDAPGPVR